MNPSPEPSGPCVDAEPLAPDPSRRGDDRRRRPTTPWDAFRPGGRRVRSRRAEEHRQPYYVDRFTRRERLWVVLLLVLSMTDAAATLCLLSEGCEEINPVMRLLLDGGPLVFLLGKYVLTAAGLPVLLIFQNHYLFGTRVRVGYLLPSLVFLYTVLIGYQACLFAA